MHHRLIAMVGLSLCSACAPTSRLASPYPRVGVAVAARASEKRGLGEEEVRGRRIWSGTVRVTLAWSGRPTAPRTLFPPPVASVGALFDSPVDCAHGFFCAWERRSRDAAFRELEGEFR